ncbi:MAG TPA: hypothetical protein VI452_00870 [Marmoricola sp.]|jgi:K+-sensing histidine kinase KdpD
MTPIRGARRRTDRGADPWFRARPGLAMALAAVLFVAILLLRLVTDNPLDAVSMLYIFPVALVGMSRGRWAGLVAGVVALGLVDIWTFVDGIDLSPLGWLCRALPLLLVGALVGDASDRLQRAASMHEAHALALQRHREAVEINDSLVQGMSAAKWSIEAGRTEAGLQVLGETVQLGHRLVSDLIREAGTADLVVLDARRDPSDTVASSRRTNVPRVDDARP